MMFKRVVAGLLSLVLLIFLGATFLGVGGEDLLEVQIPLGVSAILGIAYAWQGRLPDWAIELSGLTRDNDPSNLSPLVYLPVLLALLLVIVLLFMLA